jgi:MFS family permease
VDSLTDTTSATGSWRELLGRRYLGMSLVLAGGVALYGTNGLLTMSLLPNAVADIGGIRLYAWVSILYQVGSVVAAATVNSLLLRAGARLSYLLGLAVFGVGSLVCALSPSIEILLAGRVLQGVAGGLLAGLGYAVIIAALPFSLSTRAAALVSVVYGFATVVGPAMGGLFAQFGMWRWAFGTMVILTVPMAVLVASVLSAVPGEHHGATPPTAAAKVPVWSLLLLGAAVLALSVAQLPRNVMATAGLLGTGVVLLVLFVVVDRRMRAAVLPPSAFGPGPLKWIYLTLALLTAAAVVDMYVPLFGQRLGHLTPVVAGFLGVALMVGWTLGATASASLNNPRVIARVVSATPLVMAAGLALAAVTQRDNAPVGIVVLWAVALLITGAGVGIAWPYLSASAMHRVNDPAEASAAAAAVGTVQRISAAFGMGLAGVVVNTVQGGEAMSARWLFAVFAVLAAFGAATAYRATVLR